MGKRIVVKVGSNVLTREDGKLDVTRMSAIVDQIVWLRKHDYEVILVSSGAVLKALLVSLLLCLLETLLVCSLKVCCFCPVVAGCIC